MKVIPRILQFALVAVLMSTGTVMADPPVFENFKGKVFNAGRWLGGRVDVGVVEIRRKIKDNAMRLRIRGIAKDDVTSGDRQKVINRVWIDKNRAPTIRSMQTYVEVSEAQVVDCELDGAVDSRSEYQNHNVWFNSGGSTSSGDRRGDVYTQLGLRQTNANEVDVNLLEIVAFIGICNDDNCDTSTPLYLETIGEYPIGSKIVLRSTWDDTKKELRFYARQQGQEAIQRTYDYAAAVSDGGAVGTFDKLTHGIQARSDAADCNMAESSSPRPFGLFDVRVYNTRLSDTPDGF